MPEPSDSACIIITGKPNTEYSAVVKQLRSQAITSTTVAKSPTAFGVNSEPNLKQQNKKY